MSSRPPDGSPDASGLRPDLTPVGTYFVSEAQSPVYSVVSTR